MASNPSYSDYAERSLIHELSAKVLAEIRALEAAGQADGARYAQLLEPYYEQHLLRMPVNEWPDPVVRAFAHLNRSIYVPMQGPSEMGTSGDATLAEWDRVKDLHRIDVPTLVIGARHDTMDPAHLQMMAERLPQGRYLYCADGSHTAIHDDQETYMDGLVGFLRDLDEASGK